MNGIKNLFSRMETKYGHNANVFGYDEEKEC